ncbi:hypothetical protein I41_14040 [Lacipirellula limnantheis]|uniref:Uncharacterized protein n=2 Tax=Lacipirellula limnantheis TaxID=2528024 RepID=A0A517TV27_9BACT|nr:hypothetical protein I41_14040 [Lacipirellula limnantheis]
MPGMTRAFSYLAFLLSALFALWFVAGWVDAIWSNGLSVGAYSLLHWPAVSGTIALPVLAVVFLCLGMSLLPKD